MGNQKEALLSRLRARITCQLSEFLQEEALELGVKVEVLI